MPPKLDDPGWLNAEYDNRARVADSQAQLARWAQASALARQGSPRKVLDVPYGEGRHETLDIFPAAQPSPGGSPVLLFIHGGWWRALDKSDASFIAPSFTADGVTVVLPNYTLCPEATIEQIALQMTRAVEWTWRHIAAHGGDPSRMAVAGNSAGGHLAAMMLACRWKQVAEDLPALPIAGALAISGLYDLEPIRRTPFLQGDLRLTPQQVARLSPAFFPRPKAGKLLGVVGADESSEFLRHNQLIRDQWGPTAVPACETVPGKNHFTILESLADPAGRLHELALRLLGLR